MGLAPGDRLGPYRIEAALGAGGMGEVYRAHDPRLGRDVAVKILHEALATHPEALARFEREARAVAALNDPHIVAIHDIGTDAGRVFVAMELLRGETLRARLEGGPLPVADAVAIAAQVAAALAVAHAAGIVHRDLKPENVWLGDDGSVKLLDFGIARTFAAEGEETRTNLTLPGVLIGTTAYMAPEQIKGETAGPAADVWALGVVLWEMLVGRRPFQAPTAAETMSAILREPLPEPLVAVPAPLAAILARCLKKRASERFQSSADLAFALTSLSSPVAPPVRAGERSWWAWLAAGVGVVVLAMAGSAFVSGRWSQGGSASAPPARVFRQLSMGTVYVWQARFAPDGRTVVLSSTHQGTTPTLYVVRPEYPEPQALGPPGQHLLSVSSKGEIALLTDIHYVAHRIFSGTLARMPLGAGITEPHEVLRGVREADWAPDGERIAIIREAGGEDRLEFPLGKVIARSAGYLSDVRVSPRGDRVAFFDHPQKWDDRGFVHVADLDGKVTRLAGPHVSLQGIAWDPGGDEVLYSAGDGLQERDIRAVSLSGAGRALLQSAGGLIVHDAAAGGSLLAARGDSRSEFLAMVPGASEERDLSWRYASTGIRLSADGRSLIFNDQETGPAYEVLLRSTGGGAPISLGQGNVGDLSSDGRLALAVSMDAPGLFVYPTSGTGEASRIAAGTLASVETARWFAGNRSILTCGNEAGSLPRCYVQEVAGGAPRPATPPGTRNGWPSPDGTLVLAQGEGGGYAMYPVAGGTAVPVPGLPADAWIVRFGPDGRSVYWYRRSELPARLMQLDLASGRSALVRMVGPPDLAGVFSIFDIALADDPRWYVYNAWRYTTALFVIGQGSDAR